MNKLVRFSVVLLVVLAFAAWAPSARACTPLTPGMWRGLLFPADGAREVPLNARVLVSYFHTAVDPASACSDLTLRDPAGAAVPATAEALPPPYPGAISETTCLIKPTAALGANTRYEVADRRSLPCRDEAACAPGALAAFASFVTGAVTDTTPPVFAGLERLAAGQLDSCEGAACCGPRVVRPYQASWKAATDAVGGGAVLYTVYSRDLVPVARLGAETGAQLSVVCSGWVGGARITSPGEYLVRAVDWAGNEDQNLVLHAVSDACPSAGRRVPTAPPPEGCALGGGRHAASGAGGPVLLGLAVMAVTCGRVRRRRRHGAWNHRRE